MKIFVAFAIATSPGAASSAPEPITYRVSYALSAPDRVSVEIELPRGVPAPRTLVVPRAIPMGYGEVHFDRFVAAVEAFDDGGAAIAVSRDNGPRWNLGSSLQTLQRLRYQVDVARMEAETLSASDSSKRREGYLSLLGYSVFAFLEGLEEREVVLEVHVPPGWPVLTTLAPRVPPSEGRTEGWAANFYALADSQVVAGPDVEVSRLEAPIPLFLALYSEGPVDGEALGRLAEEAMKAVIDYFGDAPFAHYTVLQELLNPVSEAHRYGFSMEHLESSTFYLSVDRALTQDSTPVDVARTRYNFAHHFAHAWVPKRAYGKGYYPFTWELAPVLDTIWLSEGFAQYAAIDALADTMPPGEGDRYRERLVDVRFRETLNDAPLFIRRMSIVELSRVASTRYSEDFRTGQNVFSRGGMMAYEIDVLVRERTSGSKRFRDLLRALVRFCAEKRRPFDESELPDVFREATGVDVSAVVEEWSAPLSARD